MVAECGVSASAAMEGSCGSDWELSSLWSRAPQIKLQEASSNDFTKSLRLRMRQGRERGKTSSWTLELSVLLSFTQWSSGQLISFLMC
jgi:hypothetical protein